jgi:hypothetical protein
MYNDLFYERKFLSGITGKKSDASQHGADMSPC